jgi:endoglucanase
MFGSVRLRLLVVLLVLVAALILLLLPTLTSRATGTPWLSTSGHLIQDPSGKTVILRGVSLAAVSLVNTRTRRVDALIDMATDPAAGWYARVIRLPVYPEKIDGQPGWNANPEAYFTNHLDPAVQYCVSKQIYCIIDWHYIKDYDSSEVDAATRAFWSYVAPKYASTPNVIFELYNEPIYPDRWSTWKATAQPWVDLIRAAAPRNLILIGGPRWSQNVAEAATSPFTGSNLVYVAHIYPGHGGQSVWDAWFGNSASTVPYFITEWGWQQGGNVPTNGTRSGYGVPFSAYLDAKGVSWTAWVFDIYWQPVMFDTNWNLLGGEAFMGQFTKDFLFQHRNDNLPGGGNAPAATRPLVKPTESVVNPTVKSTATLASPSGALPNLSVGGETLKVQLITGGAENNQQSAFRYRLQNTGSSAQSNLSVRIYFSLDEAQPAVRYVLEKYYDQSGGATLSGPTLVSGSSYYFTIDYGAQTLPAGAAWEYQTALRLNDWASHYSGANDWWRASGALPAAYVDWKNLPAYVNGVRVWGAEPATVSKP